MIEVSITPDTVQLAKANADKLGKLRNSITHGEGNFAGCLGELLVVREFECLKLNNTKHFDLLREDGKKVEVKTKRCTSTPQPHYECSIADYNPNQQCDIYVFVRVMKDLSRAWILGELTKDEYFNKARYLSKGDYDPSNNWYCKADCWNVTISELNPANSTYIEKTEQVESQNEL